MQRISFIILVSIAASCGLGGEGPATYEAIGIYEYDISTNTQRVLKKIGDNETAPFIRYFNSSKKIALARYNYFEIIDEDGNEEKLDLDSLWIDDGFFSISPDNRYLAFGGTIIQNTSATGMTFGGRGLYLYDLQTRRTKLVAKDSINSIKYPVFSNSGGKILYKSKAYQNPPSALFVCDLDGSNIVQVAYNDYDLLKYGFFTADDKNIIYVNTPKKVGIYNLETKSDAVLIDNLQLVNGINIKEYPLINVDHNLIYFYSTEGEAACSASHIYTFNMATGEKRLLSNGMQPMSITADYILARDMQCFGFESSNLRVLNKKGDLVNSLSNGYRGVISHDNTTIVYIYSETMDYNF